MKTSKLIEQAVGLGLELQPVLAGGFFLLDPNRHQCRLAAWLKSNRIWTTTAKTAGCQKRQSRMKRGNSDEDLLQGLFCR